MFLTGNKIKGGALQYTIVFSLLILMMVFASMMFFKLKSIEVSQSEIQSQLIQNIKSATIILENNARLFQSESFDLQLTENKAYNTHIDIYPWGAFDIVKVTAMHRDKNLSDIFLFTDNIRKNELLPSLYMADANRYLSVGGNTFLGNNTYLPGYGIRKSYVGGVGFYRNKYVQGNSFPADADLPSLNNAFHKRSIFFKQEKGNFADIRRIEELNNDSTFNSFNDPALVIECPDNYYLSNKYIGGNIILNAKNLKIAKSSELNKLIVFAESIYIEDGFCGDGQFFVSHSIHIGANSRLNVPSLVYLDSQRADSRMIVKPGTRFYGDIIIANSKGDEQESLIIEPDAKIVGQVFCNGYMDFNGIVFGSLYTRGFIRHTSRGVYKNYLLNVCIDIDRLPVEYSGVSLIGSSNYKVCCERMQ